MKKLGLKWKLFAYLLGFCGLLLVILWLFQTVMLESFYQRVKINEIKSKAEMVASNIGNAKISNLIQSLSEDGEIYIEISSADGATMETSSNTKYKVSFADKQRLITKARGSDNEYYEQMTLAPPEIPSGSNDFVGVKPEAQSQQAKSLAYLKLITGDGSEYAVIINAVTTPVSATVSTLRYQLLYVTVIMVFLSVLLALLISKRIAKPIEKINRSAKVLATGNYETSFDGSGYLEIEELAGTLNAAAKELGKVEGLRRELLANVSHDLRTPLALIYSYAEMIHDFPEEVTPEQAQIIMVETQRLTALVNDVLDISKLESGMQPLNMMEFNLTRSVKETVEHLSEMVKRDGFSLSFLQNEEVFVQADEIRLTQILYNLLFNAIHYCGEDRTITVKQTVSDRKVRIEVCDRGAGIAPEDLPHIWDRYFKVDKKHRRAAMGSGLGLSIVKKIVELHGGEYGVDSKVGIGSTFWFELERVSSL